MSNTIESNAQEKMFEAVELALAAHWTPKQAFRELQKCWQEALKQDAEQADWEFKQIEKGTA